MTNGVRRSDRVRVTPLTRRSAFRVLDRSCMSAMQFGLRWLRTRMPRVVRHVAMPVLVLTTSACYRPATDARARGSWAYEVQSPLQGSRTITVEATFDNARTGRIG